MERQERAADPDSDDPFIGRQEDPLDPEMEAYLRQFAMLPLFDPYIEAHNRLSAKTALRRGYNTLDYRMEFERLVSLVRSENDLRGEMNAKRREVPDWP